MGLFGSKSKSFSSTENTTNQISSETGFNDITGQVQNLTAQSGSVLTVDSLPALNIAGEAVRDGLNLAATVSGGAFSTVDDSLSAILASNEIASERSFDALSQSFDQLDGFASGLRDFASESISDQGDQLFQLARSGGLVLAGLVALGLLMRMRKG